MCHCLVFAVVSQAPSQHDILERNEPSGRSGCTLSLTKKDLARRKYSRLFANQQFWQAWVQAGGDKMRRLRSPASFKGGELVVDIGSYIGVDLVTFLRHAPASIAVHTFEPVANYRQRLEQRVIRMVRYLPERLHVHPFGLGGSNRTACFSARLAASTNEGGTSGCQSPSQIVDAGAVIGGFRRVDLLQMNCEGCEYEVLERLIASPAALQGVRSIEVQFHLDWGLQNDTARYCAIESGLRLHGFGLDYRYPFWWERWSRKHRA